MSPKRTEKPKPKTESARKLVLQMKGSDEWKAWIDRLAKHLRMPISVVVDHALVEFAKSHGFEEAPPDR